MLYSLGRVSSQGFIPSKPWIASTRDTASSSTRPLPPDEVLFRSRGAPTRYEENDIYWADRHLKPDQTLPESDLLKALHAYASDFYEKTTGLQAGSSYESMDGSALIAFGILLEEMCKEKLGDTGDLAFVEGEDDHASKKKETAALAENEVAAQSTEVLDQDQGRHEEDDLIESSQRRKRRRIRHKPKP